MSSKSMTDHDVIHLDIYDCSIPISIRRNARAKRYGLKFLAHEHCFTLTIPKRGSKNAALEFMQKHRDWIYKCYSERPQPQPFQDGVIIPFKGIPHQLKHVKDGRRQIRITRNSEPATIEITGDIHNLSTSLTNWFKRQAREEITHFVERYTKELGVKHSKIRISDPKSRWGSCSSKKVLSFSWRLVLAPTPVLDYVVAHEVAHLLEMNHSQAFWDVVWSIYPEYDTQRHWLKVHGSDLFLYGIKS